MIYPEIKHEILDEKDVIRVDFSGKEKPYSSFGRYYKRVFDRTEEMNPYDEEKLLTGLGLYDRGKLTNAGYYLFSNKKPVVLKLAVYVTDERINFTDIGRVEDNIFNLIRKGYSYIKEHINWRVEPGEGTSRIEVPEIPVEAVREIVVNSFAHADYRGISENEIDITPTRVEIYNPGEFPTGFSPEMFARQRIRSMPRNKVILSTLYKSKDVEIFGSGFRKVYAYCDKYSIKVESAFENDGFSFIFYRDTYSDNDTKNDTKNDTIKAFEQNTGTNNSIPTDARVYMLLKEDPTQTRETLANKTGRTVRTIQRVLDKLTANRKIKRIGSKKTGYWEVF